jgi:endonuclease/exonuclease/phosphatase family metal-dependent hydrolase
MPTLKAMTWNVENLFRPTAGAAAADEERYFQKLTLLAGIVRQAAADVVALQEVGGEEPLLDLQQALADLYPHRSVSAAPDARGIRVAFLSKLPIELSTDIVDFPPGPTLTVTGLSSCGDPVPITRMGRGALRIRVRQGGRGVDLVAVHLKSKLLTYPRPGGSSFTPRDENERTQAAGIALMRRTAEAVTVRTWTNSMVEGNPNSPLVVLGDFNDVPEAQTSLLLTGAEGSELGTAGFDRPDRGDDARLFNVAGAIPLERRFSRVHRGRRELLDQIFASEELLPIGPNGRRSLPVADSLVDFSGSLASITENPGDRAKEIAPDHAAVIATFTF